MANQNDKPINPRVELFYKDPATGKPINTGLAAAALADYNSRLIVGKETVDDGNARPPVRPL